VRLQAFVTPTCPYCPRAVLAAYRLALVNPNVVAEGVEASEFPALAQRYRISGVPDTVIDGPGGQERVLGGQPDRVFVEAVLKVAGWPRPDGRAGPRARRPRRGRAAPPPSGGPG
jgi:thiol-disulfide isomerase/thioredoxin